MRQRIRLRRNSKPVVALRRDFNTVLQSDDPDRSPFSLVAAIPDLQPLYPELGRLEQVAVLLLPGFLQPGGLDKGEGCYRVGLPS